MKKLFTLSLILSSGLLASAQIETNLPTGLNINSPIFQSLKEGTNFFGGTFFTYDLTTKDMGGGVFFGTMINQYVAPIVRVETIKSQFFAVQADLQLQAPFTLNNKITVIPFMFGGAGVPISFKGSSSDSGNAVAIVGAGGALKINSKKGWLPNHLVADWEKWTGNGWNSDQIRAGFNWVF